MFVRCRKELTLAYIYVIYIYIRVERERVYLCSSRRGRLFCSNIVMGRVKAGHSVSAVIDCAAAADSILLAGTHL